MKNILFIIFSFTVFYLNAQPGTLDKSFGINGVVINKFRSGNNGVAIQHSGKIIVCGFIDEPVAGAKLARYNEDGSIDSSFGKNGSAILNYKYGIDKFSAISVLDDDRILAAGLGTDIFVAKFTADGTLDSTFGENGIVQSDFGFYEYIFSMTVQQNGKIILAGDHSHDLISSTGIVVRYMSDGILDKTFGSNGQVVLNETVGVGSVAIQKDDKIIVGGTANVSDDEFYVGRLNEDGSYDKSFASKGYVFTRFVEDHRDNLNSLVIQTDGKIIAAGVSDLYYGWDMGIARYNTDGSLDNGFGKTGLQTISIPDFAAEANTILLQKDNKIILSGRRFDDINYISDAVLVRLNPSGLIDSSFGSDGMTISDLSDGGYDFESGALLQNDGKVITVGESDFNNKYYDNIARYNNGESKKQIIITKIKKWLQHRNGFTWDANSNISSYVVQKSYDGIHFSSITKINARNSSNTYADPSPLTGNNYYRLQTTSVNGVVTFSNVIAVTTNESAVRISPNPAKDYLKIEGLLSSNKSKLTVVDFSGNVKLQVIANNISYNLNIAALKPGNYLLKIEMNDEVITKKFVKE